MTWVGAGRGGTCCCCEDVTPGEPASTPGTGFTPAYCDNAAINCVNSCCLVAASSLRRRCSSWRRFSSRSSIYFSSVARSDCVVDMAAACCCSVADCGFVELEVAWIKPVDWVNPSESVGLRSHALSSCSGRPYGVSECASVWR